MPRAFLRRYLHIPQRISGYLELKSSAPSSKRHTKSHRIDQTISGVPAVILKYLAHRCDAPDRILLAILSSVSQHQSYSIPSSSEVHLGLTPCALGATMVITVRDEGIEASIIAVDWMVSANRSFTEVTLRNLPQSARSSLKGKRLSKVFESNFLPQELRIQSVASRGPGATMRCQAAVADVKLMPTESDQSLDDVCGAVSGSNADS